MNFRRIGRYYYRRFQRLKGDPHALARGFAIGVFIGITPTMPFHTVTIILLALLARSSAIAGILSSWIVCNPLTYFPIYYFSLVIGNAVTPYHLNWAKIRYALDTLIHSDSIMQSIHTIGALGFEAVIVMVSGGTILAIPFTVISYYLSLKFFYAVKKKRIEKRVLY